MITDEKEKELIGELQTMKNIVFDNYNSGYITDNERMVYLMELTAYEIALDLVKTASQKSSEEITNE